MKKSNSDDLVFPVLPLRDVIVFPNMVIPLFVGREKSIKSLEVAMESNKQIKLNPSQIKESYKKLREQNNLMIKNICGQYRIDYVYADITKGFHQVLLQYLIKRQKMI